KLAHEARHAGLALTTARGREHPARSAGERQGLQGDMARPGHVDEKQALAAEQALRDAALELHVVAHGGLDHHHAAGVDDQPLSLGEVEVEEVAAAVQPHGAFPLQALEEEALPTTAEPHAE